MGAMLDIHNRRWWQLGNLMAAGPMTRDLLSIGELPPAPGALLGVMINDSLIWSSDSSSRPTPG